MNFQTRSKKKGKHLHLHLRIEFFITLSDDYFYSLLVDNMSNKRRIKSTANNFKDYFVADRNNLCTNSSTNKVQSTESTHNASTKVNIISDEMLLQPYKVESMEIVTPNQYDNCSNSDTPTVQQEQFLQNNNDFTYVPCELVQGEMKISIICYSYVMHVSSLYKISYQ